MAHNQNWIIVTAGGRGERVGKGINKVFLPLLGKPIILRTLETLEKSSTITKIIVAIGRNDLAKLKKLTAVSFKKIVSYADSGQTRQETTHNGLRCIRKIGARPGDLVGVHNAVNPLVTVKEIEAVFQAAKKFGGALLAMPARDTVKISSAANFVRQTPVRKSVWYAQTPQVGFLKNLWNAFIKAKKDNFQGTDDTQLLEKIGVKVKVVPCSPENFKITYPEDLVLAEAILRRRGND